MQAVLDALGIVLRDDAVLLVVNNRIAGAETALADGDEVRLIPAMSGGDWPAQSDRGSRLGRVRGRERPRLCLRPASGRR